MTMMKATPFTADELDRIEAQTAQVPGSDGALPARSSRRRSGPGRSTPILLGGPSALTSYPYDVGPITDDRPFFWHFTPYSQVLSGLGDPCRTSTSRWASASAVPASCCLAWPS